LGKQDVGITVSKKDDFSEWYTQVVLKAKLADYARRRNNSFKKR